MKHLQLFNTKVEFEAAKSTLDIPYLVLTNKENDIYCMGSYVDPYEYVDLGLPSGLKWAKCNIGAETEEGYGKYFQWGDVEGRTADEIADKPCDWEHTPFNNGSSDFDDAYFNAHKSEWLDGDVLKSEYDAAHINMGGDWRMPTKADYDELLANTNNEWVEDYNGTGVNGYLFRSQKDMDKYIFIPAAGHGSYGSVNDVGNYGYVWSSSLYVSYDYFPAYSMDFGSDRQIMMDYNRYYGFSVRGVRS